MPTLRVIRRQLYDELDGHGFGFNFTASTIAAGSVTSADSRLRDSRLGVNQYHGGFLFRNAVASADQIRTAGDLTASSGQLAQTGANWSDTSDTDFELIALHPTIFHNLVNDALELEFTEWEAPLVAGPTDADMESSDAWDGTVTGTSASNATVTKQTTAAEVFTGQRSTRAIATANSGYVQSGLTVVRQSASVLWYDILKADIGTVTPTLLDSSGNTIDSLAITEEQWVFMKRTVTVGSGVESLRQRFVLTTSADETDLDLVGIQSYGETLIDLPSWVDEPFKLKAICQMTFSEAIQGSSNLWNARSKQLRRLTEGQHWRYVKQQQASNPLRIELLDRNLLDWPLVIVGNRPWSDFGTLSADADSTNCPLHVIIRRVKYLLGARYPERFPRLAALAEQETKQIQTASMTQKPELVEWRMPKVT